jgi:phenylacetate-CoA ligase
VSAENLVVEVLKEDGTGCSPGESGEIVVTDLNNRAMPLIRYRLRDFAEVGGPCPCGRGLPALTRVWGRAYDLVSTPLGRRYHGEFFMYLFEDLRAAGLGVDQFQVVQEGVDDLEVRVVQSKPVSPEQERMIESRLAGALDGMRVRISQVQRIEREASGKLRLIVNRARAGAGPA